jgi:DNA-binding CsgD family transcriptional regulator
MLLLARNGTVADLQPGVLADLHAGITVALASCPHDGAHSNLGQRARYIIGLFAPEELSAAQARALLATGAEPSSAEVVLASIVMSNLAWSRGSLDDGIRWGRQAVEQTSESVPEPWRPYAYLALAEKLIDISELDEAEVLIKAAERESSGRPDHPGAADVEISSGRLLYASSRFRAARRAINATVDRAASRGANWTMRYGLLLMTLIDVRTPDLLAACASMANCRAEFAGDTLARPSLQYRWAEYLVSTIGVNAHRAVDLLWAEYADLIGTPALFVTDVAAAPWLVRTAQAADDLLLATNVVAMAEELALANTAFPGISTAALHARALLAGDIEGLRAAARAHCDPWAAKLAAEDARLSRHPDQTTDGGNDVGAVTPQHQGSDHPADAGAKLTATEERIARLVSRGMTNQQIANSLGRSPHTVNYHLRRMFEKLNLRSRVELATYFIERTHDST